MPRPSVIEGQRLTEWRIEMEILFNLELMQLAKDKLATGSEGGQRHGRDFSVTSIYPLLEAA
jgi:hypothetical protein